MANEIHGIKSYLCLADESSWGATPETPTYLHIPYESYDVRFIRQRRNAKVGLGIRTRKHGRSWSGMCQGGLTVPFYGWVPAGSVSIAEYLHTWAIGAPTAIELASKLSEFAEGPNVGNFRHNGLRVNQYTLAGDAQSGRILQTLDLMGKSETAVATAQTLPDDREKAVEADFLDVTATLGGNPIDIEAFAYTCQNNLKPNYTAGATAGGKTPSGLYAGDRIETLMVRMVKNSDTWQALQRAFTESESAITITIKALHNGTLSDTYATLALAFTRLAFVEPGEQRSLDDLFREGLMFEVLKPDSSTGTVTSTWSTAA